MAGIVISTIEQLKSTGKLRWHPTMIIEGELANNLMISGFVRAVRNGESQEAEIVTLKQQNSALYPVAEILKDLSNWNRFEIIEGEGGKKIKIYPKPATRREGN